MASKALTVIASMNSSIVGLGGFFYGIKILHIIMVLSCVTFSLVTCEPCSVDGKEESDRYNGCSCYEDNANVFPNFNPAHGNLRTHSNLDSICTDSHAFCFPSTLPGSISRDQEVDTSSFEDSGSKYDSLIAEELYEENETRRNKTWSVGYGKFNFFNGVVSCSLNSRDSTRKTPSVDTGSFVHRDISSCGGPLVNPKTTGSKEEINMEIKESDSSYSSSSRGVEIYPKIMDWGHKHTYFPSAAFLTVVNTCNDSILHVYEPFSTDSQFYPCNFTEASIGPGETISLCFVFLPRLLGLLSAHLVLQTSSGGFLIQAKGFAVESPYGIHPFLAHSTSSEIPGSRWNRNLSLSNSFDETLYVEEITAWLSISVGHSSIDTEAICSVRKSQDSEELDSPDIDEWLLVRNGQFGLPLFGMKPRKNWEIGPYSTETIMEVDFAIESKGKVIGAFCMKLARSSEEKSDTVVVPLKVELDGKALRDVSDSISVSLEELFPYDAEEAVVAISLRNDAPYLLNVLKITEVADLKALQIKHMKRLLLYPESDTQVALVSCTDDMPDSAPGVPDMYGNCKLLILTNDSISPQIEVTCLEIVQICTRRVKDTSVGYRHSGVGTFHKAVDLPSQIQTRDRSKADELVLENWKSQGTTGGLSVLDGDEVLFPMVQVGSHQSKWISVNNPSEKPVIMQLILNSGEIIDKCKGTDGLLQPPSSGSMVHDDFTNPSKYGFSIADGAVSEAYVQPYHGALLGPILFHPSTRCEWTSSALVRNNLSGVEWLSLKGFGGSISLLLHEVSDPVVRNIEFNLSLPSPVNKSAVGVFVRMDETSSSCSKPLLKELYAKNTGDLPLEVRKIKVSGKDCALDGFKVHTCSGFAIEPGEFSKVLISYQTDFSTSVVHRDLELVLTTGILVIPMKAILPMHMLSVCKRSIFWFRVKKYVVAIIPVAFLILVVLCFLFPPALSFGSYDYLGKNHNSLMPTSLKSAKSTRGHKLGNCNFSLLPEMDDVTDKLEAQTCISAYPGNLVVSPDQGTRYAKPASDKHRRVDDDLTETQSKKELLIENPDTHETPQPINLTIKTEKGRRRRKKKSGGNKLVGMFEVSSSHSGNSTPSSPLSPLTLQSPDTDQSVTQKKQSSVDEQPSKVIPEHQRKNTFSPQKRNSFASTLEQPSIIKPVARKPCLLPSATFPSSSRQTPSMRFSSSIDPRSRAPGSKLNTRFAEKTLLAHDDRYTYDIWGDHFSRLHLIGSGSKNMSKKTPECDSDSFFVKGPQALMTKSNSSNTCFQNEG